MTRKDFQLIASVISGLEWREAALSSEYKAALRESIAEAFAAALKATNGAFDMERFIAAATGKAPQQGSPKPRARVQQKEG